MLEFASMKNALAFIFLVLLFTNAILAQDYSVQIYNTERAFEKMVAERGIKHGFTEFLSPLGVLFNPRPVNGRESWSSRPESAAALTWNPVRIEVSSNGALGYSI